MAHELFSKLCESFNLPTPEKEYPFAKSIGRKYRADFCFPEYKLIVEIEGGVFTRRAHGSITGILHDIEKHNVAAMLGYRVLRFLPNEVKKPATYELIKTALQAKTT